MLEQHVRKVVKRYRGRVHYWDVVNEAIADGTETLRESVWSKALGPTYVEQAFRWAHETDPEARLFYNDYGGEGLGPKSDKIYSFLSGLLEKGVPVHGVGLQMHVDLGAANWVEDLGTNIRRLAGLGLEVHVTELDVRLPVPATAEHLEKQASLYAEILKTCLESGGCGAFILWGFTDARSWVPHFFKGFGEALLFDAGYQPKPAYEALRRVLREE